MEKGFTFLPPPFLGTGIRQNNQIRSLKTNSHPILPFHRSLHPNCSPCSPSLSLLTPRGQSYGPNFSRTNLSSHRRKHLRKCWDLVHICIQRRQLGLAGRFLKVVLGAHEWTTDVGWQMALLTLALGGEEGGQVDWLKQLDLESSSAFKAAHTTYALVSEYIAEGRLSDAIELLEQRVNLHPYKGRPELHCSLGMLYLFVGIQTLLNGSTGGEGVELRQLDRSTRTKAKQAFEQAIQSTEGWVRGERLRRQRIWFMHTKDRRVDEKRLEGNRGCVWGKDLLDDTEDAWPTWEHADVARVRRRLERREEGEEGEGESDASGSVFEGSSNASEGEREGGTPHTRSRSGGASPPPPLPDSDDPDAEPEELPATKGTKAWAAAWPEVADIWAVEKPLAFELAQQFLALLQPQLGGPQAEAVEEEGEGEGEGEEEAEARLRRILFEDQIGSAGEDAEGRIKKEKREKKRRKREHQEEEGSSSRQKKHKHKHKRRPHDF